MSIKALVGGVLAFLGGVAVGVLYAPSSGAITRKRIGRKGRDLGDRAAEAVGNAGELVQRARRRIA